MGSSRNQFYAVICANITSLIYGINVAWPSSNIPLLQSTETPLASGIPCSPEESSWVAAYMSIGGTISSLLFVSISSAIGRKGGILLVAIPQIASWTLLLFGQNITHLYISRFMAGFAGGGSFVLIPLYASEVAETRIRGQLGSILAIVCNFGIFLGFIVNSYLDYYIVPWICIFLDILFIAGFIIVPETPQILISKNKLLEAEISLKFYRGVSLNNEEFNSEFQSLKEGKDSSLRENKIRFSDFTDRASLKAIFIAVTLIILAVFNGSFAIISYTATIFSDAGSSLSPAMSSITVAFVQLIGCCLCSLLVDRFGRKILLTVSATVSGLSLITIGVYMYLKIFNYEVSSFRWITIVSLSTFVFFAAGGILSLPYVILPEILPQKIKGPMATLCLFELWILSFFVLKLYPTMLELLGSYGVMYCYGIVCLLGALFVVFGVPETKGKSLEEIREMLSTKK